MPVGGSGNDGRRLLSWMEMLSRFTNDETKYTQEKVGNEGVPQSRWLQILYQAILFWTLSSYLDYIIATNQLQVI